MSCNKFSPHLLVLVEDDANRQIANGFSLHPNFVTRAMQVLPPAGGWQEVVDKFKKDHVAKMASFPERRVLLVVDFDNQLNRLDLIKKEIPNGLSDRVFVLGILSEPEDLRSYEGMSFENLGQALAKDCADNTRKTWGHSLLQHNSVELDRLFSSVKPFLFNPPA